jgi:hypothetical protein
VASEHVGETTLMLRRRNPDECGGPGGTLVPHQPSLAPRAPSAVMRSVHVVA